MDRSYERESRPKQSYVDIVNNLRYGEGLLLARDHVNYIRTDGVATTVPVHYEDLNSETRPRRLPIGRPVTSEFIETARRLTKDTRYVRMSPVYPILSVINYRTEAPESRVIDIAQLIADSELEVYSSAVRTDPEGELLSLDFTELVEDMIQTTGDNPNDVLIIGRDKATALRDINIVSRTIIRKNYSASEEVESIALPHRGDTVLSLLQMSSAEKLIASGYRAAEKISDTAEISFRIIKKPDMQRMMVSLIKLVDLQRYYLFCTKEITEIGEVCTKLSIRDDKNVEIALLAEDASLDAAVYNAYHIARELFPRARQ